MERGKSFRQVWEASHAQVATNPERVASWYEGDLMRLRVGYWVDAGVAKLLRRGLPSGGWKHLETRQWNILTPAKAEAMAYAWLDEAMREYLPDCDRSEIGVTPLPGCRGRLVVMPRR